MQLLMNPYEFVLNNEPEKVSFVKKVDFLCSLPEINIHKKKNLLEEYTSEDINEHFDYYFRLYRSRADKSEALWL